MSQLYVKIVPDDAPNADGEWRVVPNLDLAHEVDKAHDWDRKSELLLSAFGASEWRHQRDGVGYPIKRILVWTRRYHVVSQSWGAPPRNAS